jgi:hypothetical protein
MASKIGGAIVRSGFITRSRLASLRRLTPISSIEPAHCPDFRKRSSKSGDANPR